MQKAWNAEIKRLMRFAKKHKVEVILPAKPKRVTKSKISAIKSLRGVKIPTVTKAPTTVRRRPVTPKQPKTLTVSERKKAKQTLMSVAKLYAEQYHITVNTFLKKYKEYLPEADYRKTGLPYDPTALQNLINDLENGTSKTPKQKDKTDKAPALEVEDKLAETPQQPEEIDVTENKEEISEDVEKVDIFDSAIQNFKDMVANYETEAPTLVKAIDDIIQALIDESGSEYIAYFLNEMVSEIGDIDQIMYYGVGRAFDYLRKMSEKLRSSGEDTLADILDYEIQQYEQTDTINYERTAYAEQTIFNRKGMRNTRLGQNVWNK